MSACCQRCQPCSWPALRVSLGTLPLLWSAMFNLYSGFQFTRQSLSLSVDVKPIEAWAERDSLPASAATGHTAAWVVYTVSQHPQVEAKIVEELKSLDLLATPKQPQPRPIQWDDVPKLTYLTAVIKVSSQRSQLLL